MKAALGLAATIALVAVAGATLVGSAVQAEDDSAFVAGGQGAQTVVEEAQGLGLDALRLSASPSALGRGLQADPARTLLVVASPQAPYTAAEADAVARWVERGGRLLVADAFGQAHTLTAPYGIAFERVRLVDPSESPTWDATVGRETFKVGPSAPTALLITPGLPALVLASSPPASFIDRDGDGLIGAADPQGAFPVIASIGHGLGKVIVVADPGLFTSDGARLAENRAFVAALLQQALPDGGAVLVDESRAVEDPALASAAAALSAAAAMPWRAVLAGLAILLLAALLLPAALGHWRAHRFRPDRFTRRDTLGPDGAEGSGSGAGLGPAAAGGGERPGGWTSRGTAAALLAGALCVGALVWGSQQAAVAGSALLAALAVAALPRTPHLRAERSLSAPRLDEASDLRVELTLRGAAGSGGDLEFQDGLPETFEMREGTNWFRARVARQAPLTIRFVASPALRGPYEVGPLRVRASDALGLRVDEARLLGGTEVRVNPRRESVRKLPFGTRIPTITMGPHLVNRAGDGSEFHALRMYQTGDSFRSVNWKASARSRELMVNQRVHESMTRLVVFLDARAVSAAGPASSSPLAHGCRTVLSIASGALRVRDRLRIVVYGDGVHELPPMPGSRQLHELTELLAGLAPAGRTSFEQAIGELLPSLRSGSPLLLASGLEGDPSMAAGLRVARAHGLRPVVVASPLGLHPLDAEDGGPEPDAERIAAARQETVSAIQALGVPVFDAVANVPLDLLFRTGGVQ